MIGKNVTAPVESKFSSWRKPKPHGAYRRTLTRENFEPTRIFDNLAIIGDSYYACFLLDTGDGLILFDSMVPGCGEYIEEGIRKLGYDPANLKHLLITHAHIDHWGSAEYFRKKFGTQIWIGETDYKYGNRAYDMYRESPPGKEFDYMDFEVDGLIVDGSEFCCGDAVIHCYETPGHTPGCISFIFDVYDEGRKHTASLWGGTGVPQCAEWKRDLLASCQKFAKMGLKHGCDVAISTHPFVDNSVARVRVLQDIVDGVPNPFVLGYEGYRRFESMYEKMYQDAVDAINN